MEENDRYTNKPPFRHVQSNYQLSAQQSQMFVIPTPKNLDENVTPEDFREVYMKMIQKYQKRNRNGKELTTDPEELNTLSEYGYQIKAERFQRKREKKR